MGKPKKLNFELIEPTIGEGDEAIQTEPYRLLEEIRDRWHDDTMKARIALAWRKETNPDPDGHIVLGRCQKLNDLLREMLNLDFVIALNKQVWDDERFGREKKLALIDHEMCHAAESESEDGEPKIYEDGRPVFRIRDHDIEEFRCVIDRHGLYKYDLEKFAESIMRKYKPTTPGLFAPEEETVAQLANDPGIRQAVRDLVKPIDGVGITSISFKADGHEEVVITAEDAKRIQQSGPNIGV